MNAHEIPVLTLLKGGGINRNKKGNTKEGFNWSKAAVLVSAGILTSVVAGYLATQHPYTRGKLEEGLRYATVYPVSNLMRKRMEVRKRNIETAAEKAGITYDDKAMFDMMMHGKSTGHEESFYEGVADTLINLNAKGKQALSASDRFTDTMEEYMRRK